MVRKVLTGPTASEASRVVAGTRSATVMLQLLKVKGALIMSKRGTQVLEEALSLPPGDRAELADRLLTSLDSSPQHGIDELWAQEAEDRVDAFERGEIKAVTSTKAFDRIKDVKR